MEAKRTKIRVFQERTNKPLESQYPMTMVISIPSEIVPLSTPSDPREAKPKICVSQVEEATTRRSVRYSKAELGLVETFNRCLNEPSTYELQIAALQNATSVLNAHIIDSSEVLEKLRELLANREMEPDHYQSIQRQRWMEERRLVASEQLSKVIQQEHLPLRQPSTSQARSSPPKSTINLVRFLESPRHRVSLRHKYRKRGPTKEKAVENPEVPQTCHHGQPRPLLLTSTPRRHFEFAVHQKRSAVSPPPPPSPPPTLIPSATSPSSILSPPPLTAASTSRSHPALLTPISEVIPPSPLSPRGIDGTATIWRSSLRPKDEILSGADIEVTIPDYVNDLLAGFDANNPPSMRFRALSSPTSPNSAGVSTSPSGMKFKEPERPEKEPIESTPRPRKLRKSPSYKRISTLLSFPDGLASRKRLSTPNLSSQPIFEDEERLPAPRTGKPLAVSLSLSEMARLSSSSGELISLSEVPERESPVPVVAKDRDSKGMGFRRRLSALRLSAH
ncbi:unnamed protein product [Cyclocybe aegerita]|uniref:Uncharacterized protein n=1 Tax=Cyclocybe aegerita TaxID=1973307 RepID=A0A8S0WPJ6_CYCAE|nr:unnamed protein product [Cyclocybe aegerita]